MKEGLAMEMSRGRAFQQVQRSCRWLMPGGLEEQQGQCSWSEVNENESYRRGSSRVYKEPANVGVRLYFG